MVKNYLKSVVFLVLLNACNLLAAQPSNPKPTLTICSTKEQNLDSAFKKCAHNFNEQWHIEPDYHFQGHDLKKFLVDYHFKEQNLRLRFDEKKIFNSLLEKNAKFTGNYPFSVLLVSLEQGQISEQQDKFLLDITSNLLQKCSWKTLRPYFDLTEISMKKASFRLPLEKNLLESVYRYQALALIGVEMNEKSQIIMTLISPEQGQQIHTHLIDDLKSLKLWLDSFIAPAYFIQEQACAAEVIFPKSTYRYQQVVDILSQEPSCQSYQLNELTSDSISMHVHLHLSELRQNMWIKKWPKAKIHLLEQDERKPLSD